MTHWTERAFHEAPELFAPALERRVDEAPEEVAQVRSLAREHGIDPTIVLDVACGIGRHAVAFADAGCRVTGLDLSAAYLERARELAADAEVDGRTTFRRRDMRELDAEDGTYDLVTNLFTSFGFFDDDTNEAVAAAMADRLADDGLLVMEVANAESILASYASSDAIRFEDRLRVECREYDVTKGRVITDVSYFDHDGEHYVHRGTSTWDTRIYRPVELRRLLERAGFGTVDLYGGLDGSDLVRTSERLVAVAGA